MGSVVGVRTKTELLEQGRALILRWCRLNQVIPPVVRIYEEGRPQFSTCAYYRDSVIHIWPRACASIGLAGPAWSYPGYSVDRTPYGVLAHELGHHVDLAHGTKEGTWARELRKNTDEAPLTNYCPNTNEWFAELFRLFVTNPTLLRELRPRVWKEFVARWPVYSETRSWERVLAGSPRHVIAATRKISKEDR